jgi:uncharacterized membrane protein
MKAVREIIISGITMLALDAIYLTVNKQAFLDQIVNIQRTVMQFRIVPAIICYILLIFGLYYFIIRKKRSILDAFIFGLVIYGVYDATNYATLKNYPLNLAIMDTVWGGTLMAATTFITYTLTSL